MRDVGDGTRTAHSPCAASDAERSTFELPRLIVTVLKAVKRNTSSTEISFLAAHQ